MARMKTVDGVPSFAELADAFIARRRRGSHDGQECTRMMGVLSDFAASQRIVSWSDFTSARFCRFMDRLVESGAASKSIDRAYSTLVQLSRYVTARYGEVNGVAAVENEWAIPAQERNRRVMTHEEWRVLKHYLTVEVAPVVCSMPAATRLLMYAVALQTGYRLRECLRLTGSSFGRASDGTAFLSLEGDLTKNGDPARQYLRPELAAMVESHVRSASAPLFPCGISEARWKNIGAKMLAADLNGARAKCHGIQMGVSAGTFTCTAEDFLQPVDSRGRHLDFHALRHTCIVWLCESGASPRTVQSIARHKSLQLTMDRYGHLFRGEEAKAVMNVRVV